MKKFILMAVGVLLFGGCSPKERFVSVADKSLPKTVAIRVNTVIQMQTLVIDGEGFHITTSTVPVTFVGAGVVISPNGHVLTCAHLFEDGFIAPVSVTLYNGWTYPAEVLYQDAKKDLALIKINETNLPYIRVADPRSLKVGQEVIAIGSPLGLDFSVTHGIISMLNTEAADLYNSTQSDAFINPGNSGGPLFNLKGELIGINSRIIPPVRANIFTGLGFSVSPGQIIEFLTTFHGVDASLPRFHKGYWDGFKHMARNHRHKAAIKLSN